MSITLRPARERGHANHGWLDTYHTFSFANYFDPAHMGFRALRVINDDVIQAGTGFGMHGHRDMEIVTYVTRGTLAHQDTTGGQGVLRRGDVQYMSAGTGLRHSEYNGSDKEDVRLLQIWILPPKEGLKPYYDQARFDDEAKRDTLRQIAGPDGEGLSTHQDVRVYASLLSAGASLEHPLRPGRGAWLQVVDGTLTVNGVAMAAGDGAAIEDVERVAVTTKDGAEFLLFDLA